MRLFHPLSLSLTLLTLLSPSLTSSTIHSSTTTHQIHIWPLTSPSPAPLASIRLTHSPASDPTVSLLSYTPPSLSGSAPDTLVRIGLLNTTAAAAPAATHAGSGWTGVVATAESFVAPREHARVLRLHVDAERGDLFGVGFYAYRRGKGEAPGEEGGEEVGVLLEVLLREAAPVPALNKPVLLDEEGRVRGEVKEEKTFLQKYWWVLALFLLMNIVASGPEEK